LHLHSFADLMIACVTTIMYAHATDNQYLDLPGIQTHNLHITSPVLYLTCALCRQVNLFMWYKNLSCMTKAQLHFQNLIEHDS